MSRICTGKGVDETFVGDIGCYGHVSNLSVKGLTRHAFPKNIAADNGSIDFDDPIDDKIYATFSTNDNNLADKFRRIIVAVKKNDTLGRFFFFENAVSKRDHIDHSKREKLKREVATRWLSEYDLIDSHPYFKDQVIAVYKPFQTLFSIERKRIGICSFTETNGHTQKYYMVSFVFLSDPRRDFKSVHYIINLGDCLCDYFVYSFAFEEA